MRVMYKDSHLPSRFFCASYTSLLTDEAYVRVTQTEDKRAQAKLILNNLVPVLGRAGEVQCGNDYEMGHTKVFLRQEFADLLEFVRRRRLVQAARVIQRAWRRRALGQLDRARNNAATLIQAVYRGHLARLATLGLLNELFLKALFSFISLTYTLQQQRRCAPFSVTLKKL